MQTHHLLQLVPNRVAATVERLQRQIWTRMPEIAVEATWEGYRCQKFELDGRACLLVRPDSPLHSNPWIWRTEFFGAFPTLDLALLKVGFHVAYIDMQNMYGAPMAMPLDGQLCTLKSMRIGGIQQGRAICIELGGAEPARRGMCVS